MCMIMEPAQKTAVCAMEGVLCREREQHLIVQARQGDRQAVRELVDAHQDRLFSFIWRMVRNHHDAEEVCQDAFLKAFASLDTFSSEYRFSTWLFTIGYRVCLNRLRRRRAVTGEVNFGVIPLQRPGPSATVVESEEAGHLKEMVWRAVDRLSPPQRATMVLFYRHESSCQEIARVLEIPVATVKSHLHRGRARLREQLESLEDEDLRRFRNAKAQAG